MASTDPRLETPERFIFQNMTVALCTDRIARNFGVPLVRGGPVSVKEIAEIARDQFLLTALSSVLIRGLELERFLTHLRKALLGLVNELDTNSLKLLVALAQQCFINEYVYDVDDDEMRQIARLRTELADSAPAKLAAIAAYQPLHRLPEASKLSGQSWPRAVRDLIRQQIEEPLVEARATIPALTDIDATSSSVQQHYEQNPYPRWTVSFAPLVTAAPAAAEILIAGCGTGKHVFYMARGNPGARILAIDISRASLAYASRKTREARLRNIEYAQADILKLGALNRRFDHIEAIGVLHHLVDPKTGWRVLLSLLKPQGTMRVALYSETAGRAILAARELIASNGYEPTPEDIRAVRRHMMGDVTRWRAVLQTEDFYYMSGCRDMLFHVIEHRFTLPDIAAFLREENLQLVEFEPPPEAVELFKQQYPNRMNDLDCWHAFEQERPGTFRQMYQFVVAKASVQ